MGRLKSKYIQAGGSKSASTFLRGDDTWARPDGGYLIHGTWTVPEDITAGGGVTASDERRQLRFVQGSGGAVDITANPQISPPSSVGDELVLIGTSNTNTLTLEDGTGLKMNGPKVLKQGTIVKFIAVTTSLWLEDTRSWN